MAWEKILACENLLNRKYMIVGWCCMCQSSVGRQVDHLQIHCTATFNLWSFFCRSFEILRVLPKKSSIICLDGEFGWISIHQISGTLFHYVLMWTIRRKHNRGTSEDEEITRSQLLATFTSSVYECSHT